MITYGFSLQGKSHIRKGVVCQDSHIFKQLENGWYTLAIADGVGSAKYSQEGSKIATKTVARFCMKYIKSDMDDKRLLEELKKAYQIAFRQIELYCKNKNGQIEDYDTTLSVAVYTGTDVFFGHAGDGGIIIKDSYGKYEMITAPQKGEDGISVRPLRAGSDSWEFGTVKRKVESILLVTDGMLDTLLSPLLNIKQLQTNPIMQNNQMNIYVTLAEFFMNADCVFRNPNIKNPNQYMRNFLDGDITNEQFNECLYNGYSHIFDRNIANAICNTVKKYNYCTWKINKVDDDKTVVCAINEIKQINAENPEYYAEPDWKNLQREFDKLAYPSLYKDIENNLPINQAYIRENLKTDIEDSTSMLLDMGAQIQLKADSSEKSSVPVTYVEQTRMSGAYQSNKRKRSRIIIRGFAIIVMIIVLIKVAKDKLHLYTQKEMLAEVSTQVHSEETKLRTEQENVTEKAVLKENLTEKKYELENETSEKQDAAIKEEYKNMGKSGFVLDDAGYSFPCMLITLKQNYVLMHDNNSVSNINRYNVNNDSNVQIVIETIEEIDESQMIKHKSSTNSNAGESTEQTGEKVKSISMELRCDSISNEESKSVLEGEYGIYCYGKLVAGLAMAESDFELGKRYVEEKAGVSWTRETKVSEFDYQIEYQGITYIVCVKNGFVTELILKLSDV